MDHLYGSLGDKPAALGGKPVFDEWLPITRPTLRVDDALLRDIEGILASGMVTNFERVEEFEEALRAYVGCSFAVALSSCTTGLMLALKCLDLAGEVILPSFTFAATAHSVAWNGLRPRFVDCDPESFNVLPEAVSEALNQKTSALLGVHVFGNPSPIEELEEIAGDAGIPLVFDSAHGMGAQYKDAKIGNFGDAEVFSFSPTKLVVATEGGAVTTSRDDLRRRIIIGRNYGNPGDYDCTFAGLSGRLPEINAVIGLSSLRDIEDNVAKRNQLAERYKEALEVPGLRFQTIEKGNISTYKDFALVVNEAEFGIDRDTLGLALEKELITTKKYFDPPTHLQKAYRNQHIPSLPATEDLASNILCLPIFSHMSARTQERVCFAVRRIAEKANEIRGVKLEGSLE